MRTGETRTQGDYDMMSNTSRTDESEQNDELTEEWSTLTGFKRDILLALAEIADSPKKSYGLAIKRALEDDYESDVNHGRLYPNLDELRDLGLIEKSELDKRTMRYELTERGYAILKVRRDRLNDAL